MKSLIYRGNSPFMTAFMSEATAHASTLKFTTREEYLAWVKNWKEEYKVVERVHRIETLTGKRDRCILPRKIDHYQKLLDKVPDLTDIEKAKYHEVVGRLGIAFGLSSWMMSGSYWIVVAMLVERKASKIRANTQRNLRLLENKQVA
jgi:hypothetical protein